MLINNSQADQTTMIHQSWKIQEKDMDRDTHPFKAFLYGMGFGAFLMFLLLLPNTLQASDENGEAVCLAKNIYFEAGNQPLAGKVAVAQVVLNRMEHSSYAKTDRGIENKKY